MSSLLSLAGMASSKKEKQYANRSARRHSGVIVVSQSKKRKRDKDTDSESVSSTPSSSTDTLRSESKCPLRFVLLGLFEAEGETDGKKAGGCPLRRVQLWHTIPLCLLAAINLLLVIVALLGLAGYRIAMGIQGFIVSMARLDPEYNPYLDSPPEETAVVVAKKGK